MKHRLLLPLAIAFLILPVAARAQNQRPPRLTTVTEDRYRLQPGDVLDVQFRYSPEFNQTVSVQPDGYIFKRTHVDSGLCLYLIYLRIELYKLGRVVCKKFRHSFVEQPLEVD